MDEKIIKLYKDLTDEALLKILNEERDLHTAEALSIALNELHSRENIDADTKNKLSSEISMTPNIKLHPRDKYSLLYTLMGILKFIGWISAFFIIITNTFVMNSSRVIGFLIGFASAAFTLLIIYIITEVIKVITDIEYNGRQE